MSLTRRQHDVLEYLRRRAADGLAPPTLDDLCEALGTQSRGSMHKHVSALVAEGLVQPGDGTRRGVVLAAESDSDTIPVVGDIAAGSPLQATEIHDRVRVPASMRCSTKVYAIYVRGDSMRDAGILDGDLAVIDPDARVRNGDIVAALIDGYEVTLKELAHDGEVVELRSANPDFPSRRYAGERVEIQGALRGILREY